MQWNWTEIENYLIHPSALERFVREVCGEDAARRVVNYMRKELPAPVFEAPFERSLIAETKGSIVLDHILQEAGLRLEKTKYWRIAAQMRPEEVHPEVGRKLDAIATHFGIGGGPVQIEGYTAVVPTSRRKVGTGAARSEGCAKPPTS